MISLAAAMVVSQAVPPVQRLHHRFKHVSWVRGPVTQEMIDTPAAATVYMEASGESEEGQRIVAHVIYNREQLDQDRFGHGLRGVVGKRKQFSCWNVSRDGRVEKNRVRLLNMLQMPEDAPEKRLYRRIQRMTGRVWMGKDRDLTGGATFYAAVSIKPYWRYDMTVIGQVGNHVMFREKTKAEWAAYRRDMKANRLLAKAQRVARRANKRQVPLTIRHRVTVAAHSDRASSSSRSAPQATKHGARHIR